MLETDISKKCLGTLIAVALLACASVLVSWRGSAPEIKAGPTMAPGRPAAGAKPESGRVPGPAAMRRTEPGPGQADQTGLAPDPAKSDFLERKAFQLEMENARLRGRLDDMLNWILDNVRGTFPLPEKQMANLQLIPVDKDMAVSADLAQLLRLNDDEVERLDTAFIGSQSVLQDLETEKISVAAPADNQVVLNIPPYAEEGLMVREELIGELKRTLGAARFDRFLQVAEAGLDEKFEYFGETDRTLQFEEVQDAQSGASQLFVRDERVVPSKDDPLRQNISASERIVTELPEEYYRFLSWLPEYVTRYSKIN